MSETPEALKLKIAHLEGKIQMLDESNTKLSQENTALNNKIGTLDTHLQVLTEKARKVAVLPYLRTKLELYSMTWYIGGHGSGNTNPSFDIPDTEIPPQLSSQTRENFKTQFRNWCNVFTYSIAPGVTEFKRRLRVILPQITERELAKEIALLHCILNNAHHGPTGIEALELIGDPDKLIGALRSWNIGNPVLLDITKIFEEITTP